ncbi:MAG: hypothetical protein AVDCRST_MAG10-3382, partial [uncultured Acidimicrobiales bacterium]
PHDPLGGRRRVRHVESDLPVPAPPSAAPSGQTRHRGQRRRCQWSAVHRRPGAAAGELRKGHDSGRRRAPTAGQLGAIEWRAPGSVGDLLQRTGPRV